MLTGGSIENKWASASFNRRRAGPKPPGPVKWPRNVEAPCQHIRMLAFQFLVGVTANGWWPETRPGLDKDAVPGFSTPNETTRSSDGPRGSKVRSQSGAVPSLIGAFSVCWMLHKARVRRCLSGVYKAAAYKATALKIDESVLAAMDCCPGEFSPPEDYGDAALPW